MPVDKSGKFFLNPQVMRARESFAEKQPKASEAAPAEHSAPAHKVEVHDHKDGSFHTITHREDGSRSREDHEDLQSVHHHMDASFAPQSDADGDDDGDEAPSTLGKVMPDDQDSY